MKYDDQKKNSESLDKLKYVDFLGFLRKVGREKVSRVELRKILITTHEIYGSEYLIRKSKEYMSNPEKFDLKFHLKLGKISNIQYYLILNRFTHDQNYLKAIEDYERDNDPNVRKFAEQTKNRILEKRLKKKS